MMGAATHRPAKITEGMKFRHFLAATEDNGSQSNGQQREGHINDRCWLTEPTSAPRLSSRARVRPLALDTSLVLELAFG
jgi:hypothetical protein